MTFRYFMVRDDTVYLQHVLDTRSAIVYSVKREA